MRLKDEKKKRTKITLSVTEADNYLLDKIASASGLSKSRLIIQASREHFKKIFPELFGMTEE